MCGSISLLLIQLSGILLCFWLKYYDITPMSDIMGRAGKWDFTADLIAALFIATPAIVAYMRKIPGWRYVIGMACLPAFLIAIAMIYYGTVNYKNEAKAKQVRMQKYDSSLKVSQAIGIPFPEFEQTSYRESKNEGSVNNERICRSTIKWKEQPSAAFFLALDSLCDANADWRKNVDTYAFDSIMGVGILSRIELSLVIVKTGESAEIEYDMK